MLLLFLAHHRASLLWHFLNRANMKRKVDPSKPGRGSRQKAARATETASSSGAPSVSGAFQHCAAAAAGAVSHLAIYLIQKFVWGEKTGVDVICTAKASVKDGQSHPDVVKLSHMREDRGHGDIMDNLKQSPYNQAVLQTKMPFKKRDLEGVELLMQSIMLPHLFFSTLYHSQPDQFLARMCGGNYGNIEEFWDDMQGSPQCRDNDDLLARADYKQKCLPLSIHGDGVSIVGVKKSWQKKADVFSFCSLLGHGRHTPSI